MGFISKVPRVRDWLALNVPSDPLSNLPSTERTSRTELNRSTAIRKTAAAPASGLRPCVRRVAA